MKPLSSDEVLNDHITLKLALNFFWYRALPGDDWQMVEVLWNEGTGEWQASISGYSADDTLFDLDGGEFIGPLVAY
jgi:hypothetical protein